MAINEKQVGDLGYVAFFDRQRVELYAPSLAQAMVRARSHFKPSKKKANLVSVVLAEDRDGTEVIHVPS